MYCAEQLDCVFGHCLIHRSCKRRFSLGDSENVFPVKFKVCIYQCIYLFWLKRHFQLIVQVISGWVVGREEPVQAVGQGSSVL